MSPQKWKKKIKKIKKALKQAEHKWKFKDKTKIKIKNWINSTAVAENVSDNRL